MKQLNLHLLFYSLCFWCFGLQPVFADITTPDASGTYLCNGDGTVQVTIQITYTSNTEEWLDCVTLTFPTDWSYAGNPLADAINDLGSSGNVANFGTTGFCPAGDSDLSVLQGSPNNFIFDMTPPAGWSEGVCADANDGDPISFTWTYAGDGYGETGASSPGVNGDPTSQMNLTDAGEPSLGGPCTDWLNPSPTTGWVDFNTTFGGAPCDPGTGCPFNELTAFEIWASEAYFVDDVAMGGTYVFSACNSAAGVGMGGQAWSLEFTIIAPSGNVDAFGLDMGSVCELTWTATESGTYLIAVTEAGACGTTTNTATDNGFPAMTCVSGPETACPPPPPNDDCVNAITLTPGTVTTGTNVSATVSQAELDTITGIGILAVCNPPNGFSIENGVWFTFTAANSGNHTIALTNVDCVQSMGVYPTSDIDCTDINNSVLDGPDANCIALGAGGDSTIVTLTAGDYYIVIDGAGGDACGFDLEVFEGPACVAPEGLAATPSIEGTSADLSWLSNEANFNLEWGSTGFAQGSGTQVMVSNPHNLTGLAPSTTYDYYIQADCGMNGLTQWIGPLTFTTAPAFPACGVDFYDIGGASGDYLNNANDTYTICPGTPGDLVAVEFTFVDIESAVSAGSDGTGCWDYISIYDGPDATFPSLGDFCNTPDASGTGMALAPGDNFTSTDPSGCLTFIFNSDASVVQGGWAANVLCTTISVEGIESLNNLQLFPNPADKFTQLQLDFDQMTNVQLEIFDVIGQIVESYDLGNVTSVQHNFDLTDYLEGVYFIRISADGQQLTKRLVITK